jgi:hypothetical protein
MLSRAKTRAKREDSPHFLISAPGCRRAWRTAMSSSAQRLCTTVKNVIFINSQRDGNSGLLYCLYYWEC